MASNSEHRARPAQWAVVGGGILGLTVAHRLARAGQQVTVIEAAPEIGGLAGAWELGGVVWDRHYHVTLLSDLHLRGLLAELGLEAELRWTKTRTAFLAGGRLHALNNVADFLLFPPLPPADRLRLGWFIHRASRVSDWRSLERTTALEWLRSESGGATVDRIWLPLLRSKLGLPPNGFPPPSSGPRSRGCIRRADRV